MDFLTYRPHPWHGLPAGPAPPLRLLAYIEITPFDTIKYEVDKPTGYLRVDRPQRTSALPPVLYGFIPRTYCGARVAALSAGAQRGDGDPLDVCVLSERPITRADVIMNVRVVGGLRLLDGGEADDKIVAVLEGDFVYGDVASLDALPQIIVERLEHYFATYKLVPGAPPRTRLEARYGPDVAAQVVQAALDDYAERFAEDAATPETLPQTGPP